ncbi:MAG: hypothetical protein IKQ52_10435 [Bacteroidales bacterium]|nr:hypothetical protein [Bacteroidales bacterium]
MKRPLSLIVLSLLLFAGCHRDETLPTDIKVKVESVSGSRSRITVAPENPHAYYTYICVGENEENYNRPVSEICEEAIGIMEHTFSYFEDGNFLDINFYRGTRQFSEKLPYDDLDYKFIVFQINPKNHDLLGEPVVCTFHTKPIPQRDLHFDVSFEGEVFTITPSNDTLTYVWQFEESEIIYNHYGAATAYLYSIVGMYQEYGFMDWYYYTGSSRWDLSYENQMVDGTHYTLVICGCEDGELTSTSTIVKFIYHPGNVEVIEIIEEDEW